MNLSRLDIILLSALVLLLGLDFSQRLLFDELEASSDSGNDTEGAGLVAPVILSAEDLQVIKKSYGRYHSDDNANTTGNQSKDAAFLANQEGELSELFTAVFRFRLRATFLDSNQSFALLESQSLKDSTTDLVKVLVNDNLHGYQIHSISEKRLVMIKSGKTVELMLYQP